MHLQSLTSLRFFAAAVVVLSHLPGRMLAMTGEGYIGVTFFFVLSGFILSYTYAGRPALTAREFFIARIARVYPLHLLTVALAIPLALSAAMSGAEFWMQLLTQVTLTQAFIPLEHYYYTFNLPSWSLSVELLFYLLFPLLITTRTPVLLAGLAASWAYHLMPHEVPVFSLYIFPPARLGDFITGILLYRVYAAHPVISNPKATALQCASVVLLAAALAAYPAVPQALRYDVYYAAPMAFVVLSFAWQNGAPARLLSNRALVFLGECSFALYLVHQLVIRYGALLWLNTVNAGGPVNEAILSGLCLLASLGLSVALFVYFEGPAKRAVAGRLQRVWRGPHAAIGSGTAVGGENR